MPTVPFARAARVLALALGCVVTAHAGAFTGLYTFGDSLSDVGNDLAITGGAVPATQYYTDGSHTGRFTNGLNYTDLLATALNVQNTASQLGGTNYAYGGARTTTISPDLAALGGKSFNQQLSSFYGSHASADPNALYVLWIGANDMGDAINARLLGNTTAIPQAIQTATAGIGSAIAGLAQLGATHFLIPDLPDLSLTPSVRSFGSAVVSNVAQSASVAFNTALQQTLDASAFSALDIRGLDVFTAQTAITNNPGAYGFSNVTTACYTGDVDGSSIGGSAPTVCADPSQYMYWDYEHPTAALHAQIAALAIATAVPEPATVATLALGLVFLAVWRRRAGRPVSRAAAVA